MQSDPPLAPATRATAPALRAFGPPRAELPAITAAELRACFRAGAPELEDFERVLAWSSRIRGALDVAIAEGLAALCQGDRLAALGCHLDDYALEVLGLGRSAALALARLGRGLRTRPLLRDALRSGRVRLRAAQTVLPLATGEGEAEWVERAARRTVRELEHAVRRAGGVPPDDDEEWSRLDVHLEPDDRILVDEALALAGEEMAGSSRMQRLEALAQEFLGEVSTTDVPEDDGRPLWPPFRAVGPGRGQRRAALEAETDRWCALPGFAGCPAPDVRFDEAMSADEVDARLRDLARTREGWDELVGYGAHLVKQSRVYLVAGFLDFRHYVDERLGLPVRAVEQRAILERRLAASPALQEARRQKVGYEKLRLLSRLPEGEIGPWIPRAKALTCVALARALEGETERQMRGRRKLSAPMPRHIAVLLAAAIQAVRERCDRPISSGKCLAIIAWHFIETWSKRPRPRKTRSREVRERDCRCCVPGCSRRATHAHHIEFRSHGGDDDPENLVGVCAFHHLRCIHGGWLRVTGRAPDALTWILRGRIWPGPRP